MHRHLGIHALRATRIDGIYDASISVICESIHHGNASYENLHFHVIKILTIVDSLLCTISFVFSGTNRSENMNIEQTKIASDS